jgi:diaminohydroxyphosphoribosylaminopyrimidine deaminase/5-amino-6-(5-phosphoribosylamino)uracil reductase
VSYWHTHSNILEDEKQQVELTRLLEDLANQGINEVLVETGARLAGAFIEQDLVDELILFTAPTLLGSEARPTFSLPFATMNQQIRWQWQDIRMVGNDLKLVLKSDIRSKENA